MTRSLALACLLVLGVTTSAASAATAPGRVAYSATTQVPQFGDGGGASASASAALPGGSVLTFAYDNPAQTTVVLMLKRNAAAAPGRLVLLRLLPDGALDPSFGAGGVLATSLLSSDAAPMAVGPDGSIVVTGAAQSLTETNPLNPSTTDWVVARLSADGVRMQASAL